MSSLDFALKDIYRKKDTTIPYLLIIVLVIALTEFLIYFTSSFGLNMVISTSLKNTYFFTGAINLVYKEFISLVLVLVIILSIVVVVVITTTLIIHKKRDIAIMKALGTLPGKLYSFYLLEAFIIFILGFILGWILGLTSFGIFTLIMFLLKVPINFQIDWFYTPIIFISCILGIFFVTGYALRKIGTQKIIKTFSADIPYNFNAKKRLSLVPKWLSKLGFNLKISVINNIRRKGEFRRYIIVFSLISLIIFTLGLGTIVLTSSSQEWIRKSQGENIVVIGHKDVVYNYSLMYKMFSNPRIIVDEDTINLTDTKYIFNFSDINNLETIDDIEKIDERLINFYDVEELDGHIIIDGEYKTVGKQRTGNFPIIGVNPEKIIQNFELEGRFFTNDDSFANMTIGDGLAYNFFEYPLDQYLEIRGLNKTFRPGICGVLIDSFFNGYAGYIGLNESRELLNFTYDEINLIILKLKSGSYDIIIDEIINITNNLGPDFIHLKLDAIFKKNIDFLFNLSLYPIVLILIIAFVSLLILNFYQRGGIIEKAKDFLIMRAIGSKNKSLKKILFLESLFIIIPALLLCLGIGMIINSIFLFERVSLPPLYLPFILLSFLFIAFIIFNSLSLIPIMKKINKFNIKDFNLY
ncbi:MAG: FtsX-like permease family protein [Candidatus Lokiarchaeota archaeon]|nr:FtsX-like permease family protein [Candidatus Lokiarchaeota archaeon]